MQLKVGILFNSPSETTQNHLDILSEKGVLDEVDAVRGALEELKFEYVLLPIKNGITSALEAIKINKPQVIFNLAEGIDGDSHMEMHIPALLELINVPYTGSSGLTLGLCLNKASAKAVLESAGIKTPRYKVAYSGDFDTAGLRFPLIIKPVSEDASLGITGKSVVNTREKLKEQIDFVLNSYSQPALVEEFIDGREFNISVIGNNPSTVLPVSELDFSALSKNTPKVCSYNAKWVEGTSEYKKVTVTCPAKISPEFEAKLKDTAQRAYEVMNCRDYARVDIRADELENIYVLEVNPNPDISIDVGLARSLKFAGIPYHDFINKTLDSAWSRRPSNGNGALASETELKRKEKIKINNKISIEKIQHDDRKALKKIVESVEIFNKAEVDCAMELIDACLEVKESGYNIYLAKENKKTLGYICFGPTPITEGVYDMYWLVVDGSLHGKGIGRLLMEFMEGHLKDKARMIVIETSSRPPYEKARRLYSGMNYPLEAKISDFYSPGDDKLIYIKRLK